MTLSEVCKVIDTKEKYFTEEGKAAAIRMDELAEEIVSKLGVEKAQEIVDVVGPGWEYEFFTLIEEYVKRSV